VEGGEHGTSSSSSSSRGSRCEVFFKGKMCY
jgi:hypothetical protein